MRPKIGLYSVTYAGMWYDGPALSLKAFVDRAQQFGFDGVELDCRAPMPFPTCSAWTIAKRSLTTLARKGWG